MNLYIAEGDHTRSRTISHSKIGAMAKFVTKRASCIGCKVTLSDQTDALCKHCKVGVIYFKSDKHRCVQIFIFDIALSPYLQYVDKGISLELKSYIDSNCFCDIILFNKQNCKTKLFV